MARKKQNVVLEDIELKPQVIGYTYKKKSNLGRVIFIFIVFILVVYYINDISVFINNLIGKGSAETIENLSGSNDNKNDNNVDKEKNEIVYNIFDNNLSIVEGDMILNNFIYENNKLTFDITNTTKNKLQLSQKKYFIETYTENKTLLERFKLDVDTINENSKISHVLNISNSFYYLVLEEKNIDDYPVVNLISDASGYATITCTRGIENIEYAFRNNELETIKHTISDNNVLDAEYYTRYDLYQNKMTTYNNIPGVTATFNGSVNGYTGIITIDLQKANLSTISENYYYGYKELPKVVKFEMQTYGFRCI